MVWLAGEVFGQVETFGLMQGVVIEQDTTVILTRDYIVDPTHILQASATHLQCKLSADKDSLLLIRTKTELPALSTLFIKTTQDTYDIIVKRTRKESITFRFKPGNKQYNAVSIVGDLTNWNPNLLFMQQQGAEFLGRPPLAVQRRIGQARTASDDPDVILQAVPLDRLLRLSPQ